MKESQLQKQILEYLRYHGTAYKVHTTGIPDAKSKSGFRKNPAKGMFDIYFISKKGECMWFEVKAKGGRLSDAQIDFQIAHTNSLVKAFVVYEFDQVQNIVEGIPFKKTANRKMVWHNGDF